MVTTPSYIEKITVFSILYSQQYGMNLTQVKNRLITIFDNVTIIDFINNYNTKDYYLNFNNIQSPSNKYHNGIQDVVSGLRTWFTPNGIEGSIPGNSRVLNNRPSILLFSVDRNSPLLYTLEYGKKDNTDGGKDIEDINIITATSIEVNEGTIKTITKKVNPNPSYVDNFLTNNAFMKGNNKYYVGGIIALIIFLIWSN